MDAKKHKARKKENSSFPLYVCAFESQSFVIIRGLRNPIPAKSKMSKPSGAIVFPVGFWFDGGLFKLPDAMREVIQSQTASWIISRKFPT
jgi:hypothetical protein